jgi:sugar lactone lactonase YvrE
MSTGAVRIAIQDAAMAPGAPAPALGLNGLHIHGSALYFTNSQQGTFARVPIAVGSKGVSKAGAVQVLGIVEPSGQPHRYDDFTFDADGRAWVTAHPGALTLLYPLKNGTWAQENAAGDPEGSYAVFTEPTSAVFGRGVNEKILYVPTEGGQVVSVDTCGK